jgi:hypothetical protein
LLLLLQISRVQEELNDWGPYLHDLLKINVEACSDSKDLLSALEAAAAVPLPGQRLLPVFASALAAVLRAALAQVRLAGLLHEMHSHHLQPHAAAPLAPKPRLACARPGARTWRSALQLM